MKTRYMIVSRGTFQGLVDAVQVLLDVGFHCQGGVAVASDQQNYPLFVQAMVKVEEDDSSKGTT